MKFTGRVWKFGDDINTDLIFPAGAFEVPVEERKNLVFSANRPGWAEQVEPGDIIVGGKNFGLGSGRPASESLKQLGISVVIAESINSLFFRNSVNFALPAMQCPGSHEAFEEGDTAEIDLGSGIVKNLRTGKVIQGDKFPKMLINLIEAGGLLVSLRAEGYID